MLKNGWYVTTQVICHIPKNAKYIDYFVFLLQEHIINDFYDENKHLWHNVGNINNIRI